MTVDLHGTVRSFEPADRSGAIFLDDGTTLLFDADAYDVGGLRLLRPGQRVRMRTVTVSGQVQVTAVTLATFAWADQP